MVRVFAVTGLVLAFAAGCSSKSSNGGSGGQPASGGGVGSSGSGGASGSHNSTGGGGASTGPVITSAPPAWVRPADCGGIGNLCPNLSGCADKSTCQLEGNVCIPSFDGGKGLPGRTADTPYCAAYTCMTFDQASCFCTGDAGKTVPGCSSPGALAGLCADQSGSCTSTPCCDGFSCVTNGHAGDKQCQVTCKTNADCPDTGCCTDPNDVGIDICSPKAACDTPCKKRGATDCTQNTLSSLSNCCNGDCIKSNTPAFAGCRPLCNTSADCDTGCCQPFSNGGGFCVDASYCSCPPVGAACGPDLPDCCAGTACAGDGDGGFVCLQTCNSKADCSSQCCSTLTGSDINVCVDPAVFTCDHP